MRRSVLSTFLALGAVLTAVGGTGLFAALSDTARTGTNSVSSGALSSSADLQLATYTPNGGPVECGPFSEDLVSGIYSLSDVQPGTNGPVRHLCLKNVGSAVVTVTGLVVELTDVDTACTGDEAESGDLTCGADQLGELSGVVEAQMRRFDCATGEGLSNNYWTLAAMTSNASALGAFAPGSVACIIVVVVYPGTTPPATAELAQSDSVTFRFAFTGQA